MTLERGFLHDYNEGNNDEWVKLQIDRFCFSDDHRRSDGHSDPPYEEDSIVARCLKCHWRHLTSPLRLANWIKRNDKVEEKKDRNQLTKQLLLQISSDEVLIILR